MFCVVGITSDADLHNTVDEYFSIPKPSLSLMMLLTRDKQLSGAVKQQQQQQLGSTLWLSDGVDILSMT